MLEPKGASGLTQGSPLNLAPHPPSVCVLGNTGSKTARHQGRLTKPGGWIADISIQIDLHQGYMHWAHLFL